jgi:hypothetical protein
MSVFDGLDDATTELAADTEWLLERFPEMRPAVEAKLAEVAAEVAAIFQPMIDFGEGKITREEYDRITAEREAADLATREAMYGTKGPWIVTCEDCYTALDYEKLPPQYPTCEDLYGETCQEDDDDDTE